MNEAYQYEYPVWFPCPEAGVTQSDSPQLYSLSLHRALMAFSLVVDIPDEKRVAYLDFGCGSGMITELIAPGFQRAVGVEKRPEARKYAELVHNRSSARFVDTLESAQAYGPFNFITAMEVIEHMSLDEAKATLRKLAALLDSDGLLYLTTPIALQKDGSSEENPYHVHEYQPSELVGILQSYFGKVESARLSGRTFQFFCWEPRR